MCGVSRGGRVFICTDFLGALADPARFASSTAILHTEGDGSTFELGGWLTLKNGRAAFEIIDNVYVFTLPDFGNLPEVGEMQKPIWATPISSAQQLAVPVSFMGIYDDCIMYTYTTLGFRSPSSRQRRDGQDNRSQRTRAFPTKAIRILSLAPDLSQPGKELSYIEGLEVNDNNPRGNDTSNNRRGSAPRARGAAMQAGLLQLMALLTNDHEDETSASDSDSDAAHPVDDAEAPVLDEAARAELYASITEQEQAEWAEDDAYEQMLEMEDRQQIAEMMGFGDEEEAMEMLRSDDEDEVALTREPYAPSLDDDEDDEDDEWEDEGDVV